MAGIPKVSVIVTVFRRTEFLTEALQSVLGQTFQDFEVIVTDDSGSDAIRAISESQGSEKIRYRTNAETLGIALNLRAAVGEARGKYVAILNDDDAWEPEFLQSLVAPLDEDSGRVLAFCDHWIVDGRGVIKQSETDANSQLYGRARLQPGDVEHFDRFAVIGNGVPLAMGSVFRIDAFDWSRVVKDVGGAYDYWITCLLAASGKRAYYVPQRLTRYRVHEAMETARQAPDKNNNLVYINQTLLRDEMFPGLRGDLVQHYARALFIVGRDRLRFNQKLQARDYLARSVKQAFDKKAFVCLCLSYLPAPLISALVGHKTR